MKQFNKALNEININLNILAFVDVILNSIIVFLLSFLTLMLFNFNELIALYIAIPYFVVLLYSKISKYKPRIVEKKYPPLNEKLRTAVDNKDLQNPVVEELQTEIVEDIKNVNLSLFLNKKQFSYKTFLILILSFAIIILASFNIHFPGFSIIKKPIQDFMFLIGGNETGNNTLGNIMIAGSQGGGEIYGEKSLAKLGNERLEIEIKQVGFELGEIRDVTEAKEFEETFPKEIFAESSETYGENIPKEDLELVKNYFKKLASG